jgi:hypothetical protein
MNDNDGATWSLQHAIYFYRERDEPYGSFSNYSRHSFDIDGVVWATVEHYFQAQKFLGTAHEDAVRLAKTPHIAKMMGNDRAHPLRDDWQTVKDDIMRLAVRRKFEAHADIREILLSTGDLPIVEDSPYDYYWGCGAERTGRNMLRNILVETRSILR